jgi:peptidoglycan/xylan/chitin deacetylase (PgdA/CDA1 family)
MAVIGMAAPAQAEVSPTTVVVSFDDGYRNIAPALDAMKERGMVGTVYVNSQRIGFSENFLTRTQLNGYVAAGFEVGGHTLDHSDLTTLSLDEMRNNVCADRTNLMNLGWPVTSFAYPFGAENSEVRAAVADCGYNSGRGIGELKSPDSCAGCDVAEDIPPADPYAIRTSTSIQTPWTLDQVKSMVTQSENGGGGLVSLVFHNICDACTTNSMSLANFTALMDWLKERPASTEVKTINQVIGGDVKPSPGVIDPVPDVDAAIILERLRTINGVNARRTADSLILYTRFGRTTTGTNAYGTEVALMNGKVSKIEVGVGNMTIPEGGYVLSGHGTASTWLKNFAKLGVDVLLNNTGDPLPVLPGDSLVYPTTSVDIGGQVRAVNGVDVYRSSGSLVTYTPKWGTSTGTNQWGFEALVVDSKITKVEDLVGNMTIPANGYVLSGHGASRTWLKANVVVGATVVAS